jgi:hypothetical protein
MCTSLAHPGLQGRQVNIDAAGPGMGNKMEFKDVKDLVTVYSKTASCLK